MSWEWCGWKWCREIVNGGALGEGKHLTVSRPREMDPTNLRVEAVLVAMV